MKALFAARDDMWPVWSGVLARACPGVEITREGDPASFDAIILAKGSGITDFSPFVNVRLVQSLWAGVEWVVDNPTLTQPLARMVDPGLTRGMVEYCTGWVLRAHLGMDRYLQDGVWRGDMVPPLAGDRKVTILGMGELGRAVAAALTGIGFDVTGYSASGRPVAGVRVYGGDDLDIALARAEILVTLLPDTETTRNLLDARRLAQMPRGAWIINPGRGTVLDDAALIAALDRGHIAHAVLDVFRSEPLAPSDPYWSHPHVTVTPHIAAATRAETAAEVVGENLQRLARGETPLYLVDRSRGY